MITAIDPGVHRCAYADLRDGVITRVDFSPPVSPPDIVVVERPEYHGSRSNAARTQDLLALSWAGARAAYALGGVVAEVGASAWNRALPKPIVHHRLWKQLSGEEKDLLGGDTTEATIDKALDKGARKRWAAGHRWYPAKFDTHNLLDAAAIACVYTKRLVL